jgi:hypothetical protein
MNRIRAEASEALIIIDASFQVYNEGQVDTLLHYHRQTAVIRVCRAARDASGDGL